MNGFVNDVDKIVKNSQDELSILICKLNADESLYENNKNQIIVSASVIKVPIMLGILNLVFTKKLSLNEKIIIKKEEILKDTEVFEAGEKEYTIDELINWMIIESDNTATNVLINKFGMPFFNDYFISIGLKNTVLERLMLDKVAIKNGKNNYTTINDMYISFSKLFNKTILTPELCEYAINILYNQRIFDQINRYIYKPISFAHKTGSLDNLNHDVGILNCNNQYYFIGISMYHSSKNKANMQIVGKIGKIAIEYINGIQHLIL